MIPDIKAVGFDLFNTLVTLEILALDEAMERLVSSLRKNGFMVERQTFGRAHLKAALRFVEKARQDGRETHNRLWISASLESQGYKVPPEDARIAAGVEAYFSVFIEHCRLIPGTRDMLATLGERYRLGLLSNFTHAPAAREVINRLGLARFFQVMIISGEVGYRKPHPLVFQQLRTGLGVEREGIAFVGDDPEADISGARQAGLQPIWTSYVQDQDGGAAPGLRSEVTATPFDHVPRISTWEDLLTLLGVE